MKIRDTCTMLTWLLVLVVEQDVVGGPVLGTGGHVA